MTKTHCNQDNSKSLGILVYQCEICGQWYASIAPLKAHKNQYHPKHDAGIPGRVVCQFIKNLMYDFNLKVNYIINNYIFIAG